MKPPPPFTIIYDDENIIAVNKASGIAVGGDRWDDSKQRLDKMIAETALSLGEKIFTVHRIDQETSGLVVFARNETAHRNLSILFESREVSKRYILLVHGRPPWQETACDLPLVPNGNKLHMTIIDKFRGKKSLTNFRLLAAAGSYSLLEARPETGRTHQIRVHAAAIGFPVACDSLYGSGKPAMLSAMKKNWRGDPFSEKPLLSRLGLHALELIFGSSSPLPETGPIKLLAPLPRDMAALVKQMEKIDSGLSGLF